MKGTDCTEGQLASARKFLLARAKGLTEVPEDERLITQRFGDLVRVVAWYGALRYKAGRDGDGTGGTLESPGELDEVRSEVGDV